MAWHETEISYCATLRADPGRGLTAGPPIVVRSTEELVAAQTAVAETQTAFGGPKVCDLIIVPDALATQVFASQTAAVAAVKDPTATALAQAQIYAGESADPAIQATAGVVRAAILTEHPREGGIEALTDGSYSSNQARMQETLVARGLVWTPTPYPFPVATVYADTRQSPGDYLNGRVVTYPDASVLAELDNLYNRYLRAVTFRDAPPPEDLDAALEPLVSATVDGYESQRCDRLAMTQTLEQMRARGYYVRVTVPDAPISFLPPEPGFEYRDAVERTVTGALTIRRTLQVDTSFPGEIMSVATGQITQAIRIEPNLGGSNAVVFAFDPATGRWWIQDDPGSPLCTRYGNILTYAAAFWYLAPELP